MTEGGNISRGLRSLLNQNGKQWRYPAAVLLVLFGMLPTLGVILSTSLQTAAQDELPMPTGVPEPVDSVADAEMLIKIGNKPIEVTMPIAAQEEVPDSALVEVTATGYSPEYGMKRRFNPDPSRAVWMSALFPGLGQIYNRRYWKLPIIVGGFMGLGYATAWNNNQYNDYARGYQDLMDNDPTSNSYMNFFPPTTSEGDLDKTWLQNILKSRKDFYRRNRDLCIICIAALYFLCMLDAYVDASLAHFDISPDLSMDVQPAMFINPVNRKPSLGLNWAFNF